MTEYQITLIAGYAAWAFAAPMVAWAIAFCIIRSVRHAFEPERIKALAESKREENRELEAILK